jgi:hypothetical protein
MARREMARREDARREVARREDPATAGRGSPMSPHQEMLTAAALLTLGLVLWLGRPPKLGRRPDPSHSPSASPGANASPSVDAARDVRRGPLPRWFTYVLISRADRAELRGSGRAPGFATRDRCQA